MLYEILPCLLDSLLRWRRKRGFIRRLLEVGRLAPALATNGSPLTANRW
jgi:hypothetical protein